VHVGGSDMKKLHDKSNDENLREAWQKLDTEVLDYVISLLRSQVYIDHTNEINSVYALIPIVVYVYNKGKNGLNQSEINKVIKWFYYSQIRQRYISQLPQKLDKDIGIVVRSANPFDELLSLIKAERPLEINPEEFIGVGTNNALYSLMRWYFKSKNAVCFTTGVGIRKNMGTKYLLEWDHIFPYSVLKECGYNMNNRHKYSLAQEITNRAIITQVANRRKSNMLAKDYLRDVKTRFPEALALQSVPDNQDLWELERYEDFIQARRVMLADELNKFLTSITDTSEINGQVTLDDLIMEGESSELEFKSSLAYNYHSQTVEKALERVILKTIAAFSNGLGGSLLIGINDEREVLGLEQDYTILQGTKDEFELHLRNLINTSLGKAFGATGVKIDFPKVNNIEICKIDVPKGIKPIYLDTQDKNGTKMEKFYVRSGNSSQELQPSEINEYCRTRF
jgi:hypothetical protein